jgi:hypothetical protein
MNLKKFLIGVLQWTKAYWQLMGLKVSLVLAYKFVKGYINLYLYIVTFPHNFLKWGFKRGFRLTKFILIHTQDGTLLRIYRSTVARGNGLLRWLFLNKLTKLIIVRIQAGTLKESYQKKVAQGYGLLRWLFWNQKMAKDVKAITTLFKKIVEQITIQRKRNTKIVERILDWLSKF